jgi:hypothetical protein
VAAREHLGAVHDCAQLPAEKLIPPRPHQPHYIPACGVLCDLFWWAGTGLHQLQSSNETDNHGTNEDEG